MITFEIVFETTHSEVRFPDLTISYEIDDSMRSDKSPSKWENEIFSNLSGKIVHIFDRKFSGTSGYRALYDDVIDENEAIRFFKKDERSFFSLLSNCLNISKGNMIYICTDSQFGPKKKKYKPMTLKKTMAHYRQFGIRINSCMPVYIK